MITSLGTCRFVIPRSESTIARSGAGLVGRGDRGLDAPRAAASSAIADRTLARPLFGFAPAPARRAYSVNTPAKNARTACPKMIGSETFIIVAFRCRENRTPCSLASAICSARNASSARAAHHRASTISPASTGIDVLEHGRPRRRRATNSIRSSSSASDRHATSRSSGSRRRTSSTTCDLDPATTRPSSAGACGRTPSPTRARGGRSCPRAAPG